MLNDSTSPENSLDLQRRLAKGLAFDDVLLVPQLSRVLPADVDVSTNLTKRIRLNIPLISAAMDTVTEVSMAIAMARQGGIGVIHKNMDIRTQARMVRTVKRSESGMIVDPITLLPGSSLAQAESLMRENRISGVPIVEESGRLVGIVTNRDLRFVEDMTLQVESVMTTENLITVPVGTTLDEAKTIFRANRVEKLLVTDGDYLTGLITVKDLKKQIQYPNAAKDSLGRLLVAAAVGVGAESLQRVNELADAGVDAVVVDSAHGHSSGVGELVTKIKQKFDVDVIAGNVATADGAKDLISAGADAIKVGIGPSGICTTRVVTGVGVPQISAVNNAARAAESWGIPVISDGGIRQTGDLAKALAAGANAVMIGGALAGTDEAPGRRIFRDGRIYKEFRGMGSLGAMRDGSADRYFQADTSKFVPEGVEGVVAHSGAVDDVVYQFVGGLRSSMGYCGCADVGELRYNTSFVEVSSASLQESHPHDVIITETAPNYRGTETRA